MGAGLCIENLTDRHVAVHLEHISVRHWALVPAKKRIMWTSEIVRVDQGAYTLRAFDASAINYQPPNMKIETAKAVVGGFLIGAGAGASLLLASVPFFVVSAATLTATKVGAFTAVSGISAGLGAAAANNPSLKTGVKRGALVGKASKYIITCDPDKRNFVWEQADYSDDDMKDDHTILVDNEGGERYINPENFKELITECHTYSVTAQLSEQPSLPECEYFKTCRRYLEEHRLTEKGMLHQVYDKCFCEHCASKRGDLKVHEMGNPKKRFTVPWGYAKFGVKIPPNAEQLDIFNQWHVCYHGTNPSATSNIMECGRLLKPGDVNPDGSLREPGPGRFTEKTAPEWLNVKQYFFSPTPVYSELYADNKIYKDETTGENYQPKIVLQVRIKPDSYKVGPSTVADRLRPETGPIDPNFSDDELEWMTDRECVHYIYGILIKLEKR